MRKSFPHFLLACATLATVPNVSAVVIAEVGPAALDALMGEPLLPVPDDGTGIGAVYGHSPSLTPGIDLPTPLGIMGFGPSHDRVALGTPLSSGAFHALPGPGPIAGSTVYAPVGATAIDFFLAPDGIPYSFEITAVGTVSTETVVLPAIVGPTYVGFGAFGETIDLISIVKLPFPSPVTTTWIVDDIRVLPEPGMLALLLAGAAMFVRRR